MNENIEQRLDRQMTEWGLRADKKKMFGGVAYLLSGKMCFATGKDGKILIRVPEEQKNELMKRPYIQESRMGQRLMKKWIVVETLELNDAQLEQLLSIGRDEALSVKNH